MVLKRDKHGTEWHEPPYTDAEIAAMEKSIDDSLWTVWRQPPDPQPVKEEQRQISKHAPNGT